MKVTVSPCQRVHGHLVVPGDKSISHRGLLFGALAHGRTEVRGLSGGEDVHSTARCLRDLGIVITERAADCVWVDGQGLRGFKAPTAPLDCGNSGTTTRLFMGFLSGQSFDTVLTGDASLSQRPMNRVAQPLTAMGARFTLTEGKHAPVTIHGQGRLRAADINLEVASAQVKSAVLLAGLYAEGTTRLGGRIDSRDHTERLLPHFGAQLDRTATQISVKGGELHGASVVVPGDPSSAAFWLAAAAAAPKGHMEVTQVLLNPTRTGFFRVLERMGASLTEHIIEAEPEPVGTVSLRAQGLAGTSITAAEVPALIDEIPLVAVLGALAEGETVVHGAEELRVKETDRIESVAKNLRLMGGTIETFADGFRIVGPQKLRGAALDSMGDHRVAMAFAVAALSAHGETTIEHAEAASVSYPAFWETLAGLGHG